MRVHMLLTALVVGATAYARAGIEWNKSRHDFGAFDESEGPVTAEFVYYNTGDEPLVVTGARANCGCTTPKYTSRILEPGDSAVLSVSYDPGGRPGRFEKKVYVDTNTEPKQSVLTIRGVCVGSPSTVSERFPVGAGPLRMAHTAALLGKIGRGHVKSVFESGYNASTDTLRPVVDMAPEWLDVKVIPAAVPPGEQVSVSLFIHSDRVPEWDMVTDTIAIRPFAGSPDRYLMPVVVTIEEDFSTLTQKQLQKSPQAVVTPARVDPVAIDPAEGARTRFTIANEGKSPLKIRRVYSATPGVTVDTGRDRTVKPGKTATVNVSIAPDTPVRGEASLIVLTVVTNDPFNPRTQVTIPVTRQH